MKKLLISLLTAAMLTTGCTQAKEIRKVNNIENKVEENIETKEDIEDTRKDGIEFIDSFLSCSNSSLLIGVSDAGIVSTDIGG